jgi:hypothetical protein
VVAQRVALRACRSIKLACYEGHEPTVLPLYTVVEPGMRVSRECVVKLCSPSPCYWVPMSEVSVIDYADIEVEKLEHNYMVTVRYYNRRGEATREEHYVYPIKVWDKVMTAISPLLEDRPPRNPGVIFIGPPGTGKSTLLRLVPEYLGVSMVEVGAEHVLSKWVGESEQRMAALFSKAEASEPSAMLVDEGDWILSPARESGGLSEVSQNVLGIVKRKLADYYKRGNRILVLFAANLAESAIDATLKREGRCGKPIVIPLPDYEAIYSYLVVSGVEQSKAERMALDAVNAGLSMADVANMVQTYLETGRYVVEPMRYRGYRRHLVPASVLEDPLVRQLLTDIEEAYGFKAICEYRRARVWVAGFKAVVSLPIVSAVVGLVAKRPVVVIDHEKYIDEAVDMINLLGAVAIVNHTVIHPEYVKILWMTADFPIVFVGEQPPPVEHATINLAPFIDRAHFRQAIVKIIAETYNIKLSDRDVEELKKAAHKEFVDMVERLALTGRLMRAFKSL